MIILKLGGSVITDKTKEFFFKQKTMDRLAKEIKKANEKVIIIHGAGSFGHFLAEKYRLDEGFIEKSQLTGFSKTSLMVQKLNNYVLDSLQKQEINSVSIPPHVILKLNNHRLLNFNESIFDDYLKKDFTPVTFGDVVLDEELGFSICSGDLLLETLVEFFRPDKAIFAIDEDGLYTSNPKMDKKAEFLNDITPSDLNKYKTNKDIHPDVTGGMYGKINTIKKISKHGVDTFLLNGNKTDRLYKVMIGKKTKSTRIRGEKR